jgi:hypothetical protein
MLAIGQPSPKRPALARSPALGKCRHPLVGIRSRFTCPAAFASRGDTRSARIALGERCQDVAERAQARVQALLVMQLIPSLQSAASSPGAQRAVLTRAPIGRAQLGLLECAIG